MKNGREKKKLADYYLSAEKAENDCRIDALGGFLSLLLFYLTAWATTKELDENKFTQEYAFFLIFSILIYFLYRDILKWIGNAIVYARSEFEKHNGD